MKKIYILLFTFILLQLTSFAANWVECGYKTWVDIDSVVITGKEISAWFKELNPGDWELLEGKKVGYEKSLYITKIGTRQIGLKSVVCYDASGKVLYTESPTYFVYRDVIPETVGEVKYNVLLEIYSECKKQKILK